MSRFFPYIQPYNTPDFFRMVANALNNLAQTETGLKSYTVATLPVADDDGRMIFVTDEVGGAVPAFSSGGQWLRVTDRAVVS